MSSNDGGIAIACLFLLLFLYLNFLLVICDTKKALDIYRDCSKMCWPIPLSLYSHTMVSAQTLFLFFQSRTILTNRNTKIL